MPDVTTIPPPSPAEINLAIIRPLVSYFEHHQGRTGLEQLAQRSGMPMDTLRQGQGWVPLGEIEAVFAAARSMLDTDARFVDACAHEIVKSYGLMALVFRARPPSGATSACEDRPLRKPHLDLRARRMSPHRSYFAIEQENGIAADVPLRQAQLPTMPLLWWGLQPRCSTERGASHTATMLRIRFEVERASRVAVAVRGSRVGCRCGFGPAAWRISRDCFAAVGSLSGGARFSAHGPNGEAFHVDTTSRVASLVKENQDASNRSSSSINAKRPSTRSSPSVLRRALQPSRPW